jgi:hypothetical protein
MNYKLPDNTLKQVAAAAIIGFGVQCILSSNPMHGVVCAALSALATAIHAAAGPVFKEYTHEKNPISHFLRTGITVLATLAIGASLGYPVRLVSNLALNAIFEVTQTFITGYTPFDQARVLWLIK